MSPPVRDESEAQQQELARSEECRNLRLQLRQAESELQEVISLFTLLHLALVHDITVKELSFGALPHTWKSAGWNLPALHRSAKAP